MNSLWLLLLLPLAAGAGWLAAVRNLMPDTDDDDDDFSEQQARVSKRYLQGLSYLLNEESDKAIDVFIKMVEVDSDTVETHLALGNLFRKRGEIERATRIHQNLIARPHLEKTYRVQALFALANDYFSAGLLDRAEKLFLTLIEEGEYQHKSLLNLLDIYEQEKEWEKAIQVAQKIKPDKSIAIAHYYCELADEQFKRRHFSRAAMYLRKAFAQDSRCVRASLLLAKLEMELKRYKQAIRSLKRIRTQNVAFFSEAILPLSVAYQALGKGKDMFLYFKNVLEEFPNIPIATLLSERIRQWRGDKVATDFVADYVRKHPSIVGLHHLLKMYLPITENEKAKNDLRILSALMEKLIAKTPLYQCSFCGFSGKTLHWQCPGCKEWSVIKPTCALEEERG